MMTAAIALETCPCGAAIRAGQELCDPCFAKKTTELRERVPPRPRPPPAPQASRPAPPAPAPPRPAAREQPEYWCACGARVLRAGASCSACREKEAERHAREVVVSVTVLALPERYRWAAFESPLLASRVRDAEAIARARKAVADGVDRFLFLGPPGVGKTVLAACVLRENAARRGQTGMFTDATVLANARTLAPLGAEAPDVVRALQAEALVLDELAADPAAQRSAVAEVLHQRHAQMRLTIVTSGYSFEQLEQRYGGGIFRRLVEQAEVIAVRPRKGGP